MYFNTKNGPVYEPENAELRSFYNVIKKHSETLDGSPIFEDLVEVYSTLELDLKEDKVDEPVIRAV